MLCLLTQLESVTRSSHALFRAWTLLHHPALNGPSDPACAKLEPNACQGAILEARVLCSQAASDIQLPVLQATHKHFMSVWNMRCRVFGFYAVTNTKGLNARLKFNIEYKSKYNETIRVERSQGLNDGIIRMMWGELFYHFFYIKSVMLDWLYAVFVFPPNTRHAKHFNLFVQTKINTKLTILLSVLLCNLCVF